MGFPYLTGPFVCKGNRHIHMLEGSEVNGALGFRVL